MLYRRITIIFYNAFSLKKWLGKALVVVIVLLLSLPFIPNIDKYTSLLPKPLTHLLLHTVMKSEVVVLECVSFSLPQFFII